MTALTGSDPTNPPGTRAVDRHLARYVRRTIYPYSAYYRAVLDGAGVGGNIKGHGDLLRVPPTDLGQVEDPGQLVLRPDLRSIVREGQRGFAARAVTAKVLGGMHGFNRRVVEHRFKPVHWIVGDGVPIGYSSADVQRLASYGREWLERAGVSRDDVLLSIVAAGPTVAHWQLVLGCRRAGVSAIHLDPGTGPEIAERMVPSVLAGDPQQLVALLARARDSGHRLANLRTILAVGDPLSAELRGRLESLGGRAAVVGAWAPPGVRALWTECREGAERSGPTGYHAWDDDVLELAGPDRSAATGELLWTGLGWRGSAVLRLLTYTNVALERAPCPACGRSQPRIVPLAPVSRPGRPVPARPATDAVVDAVEPAGGADPGPDLRLERDDDDVVPVAVTGAEAVLDAEAEVSAWQVEYRVVDGAKETIVVLAPAWGAAVVPLIRRLDRHLRATQFVVLEPDEVAGRIDAAGGLRIIGEEAA